MKIIFDRAFPTKNYIIDKVYINDKYFSDALELPYLDNKPDISAIVKGEYLIYIRYSNNFKMWLPEIQNVPNRTNILIHPANFVNADGKPDIFNEYDQLQGCMALGKNKVKGQVIESRVWQAALMEKIYTAMQNSEPIIVKII
jgi:hypothetical protein